MTQRTPSEGRPRGWPALLLWIVAAGALAMGFELAGPADEFSYMNEVHGGWTAVEGQVVDTGRRFGGATAVVEYEAPPGATRPEDQAGAPVPLRGEFFAPRGTEAGDTVRLLVDPGFAPAAVVDGAPVGTLAERLRLLTGLGYLIGALAAVAAFAQVARIFVAWRGPPGHGGSPKDVRVAGRRHV